jgi:protoporphyrinogen oxidase
MEKLAIIGSGISGTPIAYYLQDQYEVDVYEKKKVVVGSISFMQVSNYTYP